MQNLQQTASMNEALSGERHSGIGKLLCPAQNCQY